MTFSWKKFRHLVGVYAVLGFAASFTPGLLLHLSSDAMADDGESKQVTNSVESPTSSAVQDTSPEALTDTPTTEENIVEIPVAENTTTVEDTTPSTPDKSPVSESKSITSEATSDLEEEPSPYLEVRSLVEAVIAKIDWLYTLRPLTDYDSLSLTKSQTTRDLHELILVFEVTSSDQVINDLFCTIDNDLLKLETYLAPGLDDTQPEVDDNNRDILRDMNDVVQGVRILWLTETGSTWQCGA